MAGLATAAVEVIPALELQKTPEGKRLWVEPGESVAESESLCTESRQHRAETRSWVFESTPVVADIVQSTLELPAVEPAVEVAFGPEAEAEAEPGAGAEVVVVVLEVAVVLEAELGLGGAAEIGVVVGVVLELAVAVVATEVEAMVEVEAEVE